MKHQEGSFTSFFYYGIALPDGRPVEHRIVEEAFKKLCHQAGVREVVFHTLRNLSTSLKLQYSGGDIKAVQGDTGHAQSRMVTDVYSHIMTDDRKSLAKKVNEQFLQPERKEKAAVQIAPALTQVQLIQLLQSSPELAGPLLQMYQILEGANT